MLATSVTSASVASVPSGMKAGADIIGEATACNISASRSAPGTASRPGEKPAPTEGAAPPWSRPWPPGQAPGGGDGASAGGFHAEESDAQRTTQNSVTSSLSRAPTGGPAIPASSNAASAPRPLPPKPSQGSKRRLGRAAELLSGECPRVGFCCRPWHCADRPAQCKSGTCLWSSTPHRRSSHAIQGGVSGAD